MVRIGVAVKTLFILSYCVVATAFAYLFIFGHYFVCFDPYARWFPQIVAEFTIYSVTIGAWVAYKESSWIIGAIVMVGIYFLGGLLSIGYILWQFYKLSNEESLTDPLYFVLARREKRDASKGETSVLVAIAVFLVIGCLMLEVLIYTIIDDISYTKYFTSCTPVNVIDLYMNLVILSVWIGYKESNWMSGFFWITLLLCFRSVTICAYILWQLFHLSHKEHAYLVIFNTTNRDLNSSDPLLTTHPNSDI